MLDKLLPLWGGKEIDLIQAEKLREDTTNDEATATVLNDAGKVTKIYSKNIRNSFLFPVINEDALILILIK